MNKTAAHLKTALRIALGFIFLWAFADKLFGLGFSTTSANAWIHGGSPTRYYLGQVAYGPVAPLWHAIAGNILVDWLFMLGLLGIGLGLVSNKYMKATGWAGAVLMLLMWMTSLLPKTNPLIDDHIIYGLLFLFLAYSDGKK